MTEKWIKMADGNQHHLVVNRDAAGICVYVDGAEVVEPYARAVLADEPMCFYGNVGAYDYVLSPEQVRHHYNAGPPPEAITG